MVGDVSRTNVDAIGAGASGGEQAALELGWGGNRAGGGGGDAESPAYCALAVLARCGSSCDLASFSWLRIAIADPPTALVVRELDRFLYFSPSPASN